MEGDPLLFLLSAWVFFIYSAICIISLIFTVSLSLYDRIDRKLGVDFLAKYAVNFFDRNVYAIDDWLKDHNRIVGPLLMLLSLIDLNLTFQAISKL